MTEHAMDAGHDRVQDVEVAAGGHNRRKFLAGAGAAALGAAAVAATVTAVPAADETDGADETYGDVGADTSAEAVVAYVSDGSKGEITLFRGGHEVVVQDGNLARALTSRLDQALAGSKNQEL